VPAGAAPDQAEELRAVVGGRKDDVGGDATAVHVEEAVGKV
jgi:hypothetical protein